MCNEVRWLAPILGLVLAASSGVAGPMGWSTTTRVTSLNGLEDTHIFLGTYRFPDGDGTRTVYGYAPVAAGLSGSGEGSTTTPVTIAETSRFGAELRDDAPPHELNSGIVDVLLTVTDTESGESFGSSFSGRYEYAPTSADDTSSPLRLVLNYPDDAPRPGRPSGIDPRVLGGNRYEIYFGEDVDDGNITGLGIGIAVTSVIAESAPPSSPASPVDAPEPATLALAALGLGVAVIRRVR